MLHTFDRYLSDVYTILSSSPSQGYNFYNHIHSYSKGEHRVVIHTGDK